MIVKKLAGTLLLIVTLLGGIGGQFALAGDGSCEFANFPYDAQGKIDWPYGVKVLRQDAQLFKDAGSSSTIGTLNFNQNFNVEDVQGNRIQVKRITTGEILGWVDRTELLCAISPLKGAKSGLEQKFYISTGTEIRKDKPGTVKAYPSAMLDSCDGKCRELSRFTGYFIFDYDKRTDSYLLSESYKLEQAVDGLLVGWVSGANGFVWDTAYGTRPREDLVFPPGHEKEGQPKSVCAYSSLEKAINDPIGACMPILGGDEWFLSENRIPVLERIENHGENNYYKVVLPLAGTGATYDKDDEGKITIIEPGNFTQNPGIETLRDMKNIDVLFLIDGTKSLKHHIDRIKGVHSKEQQGLVQEIIKALKEDEMFQEAQFRFAFRIYRDTYAGDLEFEPSLPLSPECGQSHEDLEQNLREFSQTIDLVKVTDEKKDDYPENVFGGIGQAVKDLAPCPTNTKILFVIGDCGYDAAAQRAHGASVVEMNSLINKLRGGNGIKNIVTFFIQTPQDASSAKNPEAYNKAYTLFTDQARQILRSVLGSERSNELDNYLLISGAEDLDSKILDGIKQFSNTQVINELVLDLRGGTALKDAIERLKGSDEYHNIRGLFWDLVEQGSCRTLGDQCEQRVYDTVLEGYIPISDDLREDIWLKSDDLDKFTGLLREFDSDRLAALGGTELRKTFVQTMKDSLQNVIRKPLYEETGESMKEYLKRKGGLPVSDTSPLFAYSIDDLNDPDAVPDCELVRLINWTSNAKRMLNILYQGDLKPDFKPEQYLGDCPTGDHIPYSTEDIPAIPLGNDPAMRYNHSFQKANVYWVPKEYLP